MRTPSALFGAALMLLAVHSTARGIGDQYRASGGCAGMGRLHRHGFTWFVIQHHACANCSAISCVQANFPWQSGQSPKRIRICNCVWSESSKQTHGIRFVVVARLLDSLIS
jgi:hypothetical protein